MDKEKEIEEIARIIGKDKTSLCKEAADCKNCRIVANLCEHRKSAADLYNAGYGNIEQAVKEFAEGLKKERGIEDETYGSQVVISYAEINELIKELYGKGEA